MHFPGRFADHLLAGHLDRVPRRTTLATRRSTPSPSPLQPGDAGSRPRHIDTISGATYISDGYIASLQSALDKAGL